MASLLFFFMASAAQAQLPYSRMTNPPAPEFDERVYTAEQRDRLDAVHFSRYALLLIRDRDADIVCDTYDGRGFLAHDTSSDTPVLVYLARDREVHLKELALNGADVDCDAATDKMTDFADEVEMSILEARQGEVGPLACPPVEDDDKAPVIYNF